MPRPSRAPPQTPLPEPTLRERTDLPSFVVVVSSLGSNPTSSAPPRLKANPSRSRPRGTLRQAPASACVLRDFRAAFFSKFNEREHQGKHYAAGNDADGPERRDSAQNTHEYDHSGDA